MAAACTGAEPEATSTTATTSAPATTIPIPTPTATASPAEPEAPPLYLVLMWAQHQPVQPRDADGSWPTAELRHRAVRDYTGLLRSLAEEPSMRATIAMSGVLAEQLSALAAGQTDVLSRLAELPTTDLTASQRAAIVAGSLDMPPAVMEAFPRYAELVAQGSNPAAYNTSELRDLQVIGLLAWLDQPARRQEPIAGLIARGEAFSEEDKSVALAAHREAAAALVGSYRRAWSSGQLEIAATPFAAPILPLLIDPVAAAADQAAIMPTRPLREVSDAADQIEGGLAAVATVFGRRPAGVWPAAGSVSADALGVIGSSGASWVVAAGSSAPADVDTNRAHLWPLRDGSPLVTLFADDELGRLFGDDYASVPAGDAAADFLSRLTSRHDASSQQPQVVTVVIEDSTVWDRYSDGGSALRRELFSAIASSDIVTPITPAELAAGLLGEEGTSLRSVVAATSAATGFAPWIGDQAEATAWDWLAQARADYREAEQQGQVAGEALESARQALRNAESGDWFRSIGGDTLGGDATTDGRLLADTLAAVYTAIGSPLPDVMAVPLVPLPAVGPNQGPGQVREVTVDNLISPLDWTGAARYDLNDPLIDAVYLSPTLTDLQVRVDFSREMLGDENSGFDLYLAFPGAEPGHPVSDAGNVLGFEATHVIRWRSDNPTSTVGPSPHRSRAERLFGDVGSGSPLLTGFDGDQIEFTVSLDTLGSVRTGDTMLFRFDDISDGQTRNAGPVAGPGALRFPVSTDPEPFLVIEDPVGDDYGPGSYVYPTGTEFSPGSFDLTRFEAAADSDDLLLTITLDGDVTNPWNGGRGFSLQTFDIYIDMDPGSATGAAELLPGRNAALTDGYGWELAIVVDGWQPALFTAPDRRLAAPMDIVLVAPDQIEVRLARDAVGTADPAAWGYAVAVLPRADHMRSERHGLADIAPEPTAHEFGSGGEPVGSRIIDLLAPDEGTQESLLLAPVDDTALPSGGFGRIPTYVR